MNNRLVIQNILRFIGFILVQVTLLNYFNLHGWIDPQFYPMFILLLPIRTPSWVSMLSGLIIGLLVGSFVNSSGMHAAASVFLGFCRPLILTILTPRNGYDDVDTPSLKAISQLWYFSYVFLGLCLHHLFLFSIEYASFEFTGTILAKSFFSLFISSFSVLVYSYIFTVPRKKR